ncbi:hypothetical protein JW933_07925 [candidate division FCPU426 bacterium]|nr:hypothetical protein [candidate division FCPU426 bacterium]
MKKLFNWQVTLGILLVGLSIVFYLFHYSVFRDAHHIFLYLIGDIAFLFLDVLIVTMVLHRLLEYRDKQSMLRKLNMVIGTFFSEAGTELLKKCSQCDPRLTDISSKLVITNNWGVKEFSEGGNAIKAHTSNLDSKAGNLVEIKDFLLGKRPFLLNLLENPNLLEHESFTELLWAVFHLTDELAHRKDLAKLPASDCQHLAGDIKRAYQQLVLQWLDYMKHLKQDYPYLFSLAIRTNPFDANASVEVR